MSCFRIPIYIGEIRHKDVRHPGLHEPIVDRELWEKTQLLLRSHAVRRAPRATKSARQSAHGQAVRRKRPEPDAESRGEGRAQISLLRVAQPDQRNSRFGRTRLALASAGDRAHRRSGGLHDT